MAKAFPVSRRKRLAVMVAAWAAVQVIVFAITGDDDLIGQAFLGIVFIGTVELALTLVDRSGRDAR